MCFACVDVVVAFVVVVPDSRWSWSWSWGSRWTPTLLLRIKEGANQAYPSKLHPPPNQGDGRPGRTVERQGRLVVALRDSRGGVQALRQRRFGPVNRRDRRHGGKQQNKKKTPESHRTAPRTPITTVAGAKSQQSPESELKDLDTSPHDLKTSVLIPSAASKRPDTTRIGSYCRGENIFP